ncbi:MAG: Rrf2 family transcriptional regulator [bacterium]|nr:Rrf2 family transcriptional regulator [bacterium]
MRLTTKCRYGTRAMVEMGLAYGKGSMQLSQIAENQDISPKYLVHLLASLKAAGLVKTVRGARGGYLLDKPPSDIKLIEIFRVLEGSTSPVECVDDPKTCPRSELCVTRGVWARIRDAMNEVLESTTLQDLIVERKQKEEARKEMYYI